MARDVPKTARLTDYQSRFLDFVETKTFLKPATFIAKATDDAIHSAPYAELLKEFEDSLSNERASMKMR